MRGIASAPAKFFSYLCPPVKGLSIKPDDRYRNAFELPWNLPKVIMNANRKSSVYPWRVVAFPDYTGLIVQSTFKALWPAEDWSPELLAAVLNGPLISAYVAVHEPGPEITNEVLDRAPVPWVTPEMRANVNALVNTYVSIASKLTIPSREPQPNAERVLREIDATILQGYDLPPKLERKLLDYFNGVGNRRPVGFPVTDYFPTIFRPLFSLADYISSEFHFATAKRFKQAREIPSESILESLRAAANAD